VASVVRTAQIMSGFSPGISPNPCYQDSRSRDFDFPKWEISRHVASVVGRLRSSRSLALSYYSPTDRTVVSDYSSLYGISSVDSILRPYAVIPGFQEDRSSSCRFTKVLRLHLLPHSSSRIFPGGYLYGEVYPGYCLRQVGVSFSREPDVKAKLDQYA
jgi:hypothetical protein